MTHTKEAFQVCLLICVKRVRGATKLGEGGRNVYPCGAMGAIGAQGRNPPFGGGGGHYETSLRRCAHKPLHWHSQPRDRRRRHPRCPAASREYSRRGQPAQERRWRCVVGGNLSLAVNINCTLTAVVVHQQQACSVPGLRPCALSGLWGGSGRNRGATCGGLNSPVAPGTK